MPTNHFPKILQTGPIPNGHSSSADLVDHVIPLWLDLPRNGDARPTTRIGGEVLTAETAGWCTGTWKLHLFSFVSEAQQAQQTLSAIGMSDMCEAGVRVTGEGLILLRMDAEGPFDCTIVDRRRVKDAQVPVGSWQVASDIGHLAALHVPCRAVQRAEAMLHKVEMEFDDPEDRAQVTERLGAGLVQRTLAGIRLDDVVEAANRLLEPIGAEVTCSDRRIAGFIDSFVTTLKPDLEGLVERLAHDLVAELADYGGIG